MIKIGPAGNTSYGKPWDDEGKDKIAQIFISHGEEINSLQFVYVENGTSVLSEKHGGDCGPKFNVVTLDYPSEYLVGISGSYSDTSVSSISFITNNMTYGPFGSRGGDSDSEDSDFEYHLGEDRSFGGFHGRARHYLDAIGVYLKPVTIQGDVKVNIEKHFIKKVNIKYERV
ncbi:hypothetical protein Vadar_030734 [Vaccinium darrowii]|uniref:Uncharacterized protein n=1 Tax=Vaccinium darrowii TaxID=229202 RepID=A0ACB7XVV8_9ERIC|nr:hypothetical protein Vadar_030734 [Vaccinium darrowii]